MKALVTGADGFVGRWLSEHLEAAGDEVWRAPGRSADGHGRERAVDLADGTSVCRLLEWAKPDAIYHMAAVSFGPDVAGDIGHAIDVTVRGTALLLDAAAAEHTPPVIMIPSSAEVYGRGGDEPIAEGHAPAPSNLYGATKLAQESIALAFHRLERLPVVLARAFNHVGPGQRESFVLASFAGQLAEIAAHRVEPVLRVGNLDARRDFTDVRDVVRAYRLLVAGRHAGEPINVASGSAISIRSIVDRLIAISALTVDVVVETARLRVSDVPVVVGDISRLQALTGWQPEIPLDQTLGDVWQDALSRHR